MRCDNEWVPEIKVVTPACQRMQHQIRHQGIVICAGSGTFSTQVVITTWMRGPTVAVQSDVLVWFTRTQFINSTNRPECTLSPWNPIGNLKLICLFFHLTTGWLVHGATTPCTQVDDGWRGWETVVIRDDKPSFLFLTSPSHFWCKQAFFSKEFEIYGSKNENPIVTLF